MGVSLTHTVGAPTPPHCCSAPKLTSPLPLLLAVLAAAVSEFDSSTLIVTGAGFNTRNAFRCRFTANDPVLPGKTYTALSVLSVPLTPTQLECTLPQWIYQAMATNVSITRSDGSTVLMYGAQESNLQLQFVPVVTTVWQSSVAAAGDATIDISGSGFSMHDLYDTHTAPCIACHRHHPHQRTSTQHRYRCKYTGVDTSTGSAVTMYSEWIRPTSIS